MDISGSENGFAIHVARTVVEDMFLGKVLYCGGDDLLAMVGIDDLLSVMLTLRYAYSGDPACKTLGFVARNVQNPACEIQEHVQEDIDSSTDGQEVALRDHPSSEQTSSRSSGNPSLVTPVPWAVGHGSLDDIGLEAVGVVQDPGTNLGLLSLLRNERLVRLLIMS
jgi:hypothetical protein